MFSATKSKIMKFVSSKECGVMRKEIYAQFPPELQPIVLKGLNALISDGKIYKLKQNDRLLFIAAK